MYLAKLTLETTPQQMFDEIKRGFEAGNFPSKDGNVCLYRSNVDGVERCCLAGMFISNESYNPRDENRPASSVLLNKPSFLNEIKESVWNDGHESKIRNIKLINKLQNTHDYHDWTHPELFLDKVKAVFEHYIPLVPNHFQSLMPVLLPWQFVSRQSLV